MPEFRMPSLGSDMDAGTLVRWRCAPGDRVARGTIMAEVETDKGIIEIEAYESGVVDSLVVPVGTKVPVGTVLAKLSDASRATAANVEPASKPTNDRVEATPLVGAVRTPDPRSPASAAPAPSPRPPRAEHEHTRGDGHVAMSPLARRRAREAGIDPSTLHGTGPHGAITVVDIERAQSAAASVATGPDGVRPGASPSSEVLAAATNAAPRSGESAAARMRRAIAASMSRSKREIPHYYVATTADLFATMRWLEALNANRPPASRVLPGLLFARATARAVAKVPEINGHWDASTDAARMSTDVHVGVAVSLRGGGLVAPALRDTGTVSLDALGSAFLDVVQRARSGSLRSSEMSDPTITVTSLGDRGVETVFPVIIPPQLAIVGFGKVVDRPWAVDGMLAVRPLVNITLAGDHRATDGHRGALYLAEIARLLTHPEELA